MAWTKKENQIICILVYVTVIGVNRCDFYTVFYFFTYFILLFILYFLVAK